ncbi:MobF family relaxase [Nocardioides luteus]|uniref:MobF family relaxase n=1 Tax=Nocardioides luteus TaxID=1844 RepID=UPI001A33F18C|nr:MobF family relaxase [Nocardioides luteus]MBG6095846.1 conjugative relaxase-like TrwC/TraI family protein [Nocardioides luteus]
MKFYTGRAVDARRYVEADSFGADDYYLGEGSGVADRYVVSGRRVAKASAMDAEMYERWVGGFDVTTGEAKGRLRKEGVKFVEVAVNGPKSWSLAAAAHPDVSVAYDVAQRRAAEQILSWVGENATTRVGPLGRQVQVPVEELEAAVVAHRTSRAGDPHWHLHLQVNARVWAQGRWRGLHTVGFRESIAAINGIGHAAVMTDPGFRSALVAHGYHVDPVSGEIVELEAYGEAFSARSKQIGHNMDRYETQWRGEHPGEEPGPRLRQVWDRRAWADERPDKVVPTSGAALEEHWCNELAELGFRPPRHRVELLRPWPGMLDRDALAAEGLCRLGARRSAWSRADARGEAEQLIVESGLVVDASVRAELAEDLTARIVAGSVPLVGREDVPVDVRSLTSPRVVAVERHLVRRFAGRADEPGRRVDLRQARRAIAGLGRDQIAAVEHLAGSEQLVVIEGAAGAGKTAALAAARRIQRLQGREMVVVSPTLKGAKVAAGQVGTSAYSVAWLLRQYGFRWDDHGHWERVESSPHRAARLQRGDLLVVDEAGMLDQDSAVALVKIADLTGARLALVGDRHQLPAVGRGGVLDLACRYAGGHVDLDGVRRFADPEYARISLAMRAGKRSEAVFDRLMARGEIVVHASEVEQIAALADIAATAGDEEVAVVADTRDQVARINGLAHRERIAVLDPSGRFMTRSGERIEVGDRVATRRNDPDADVANRETWTVRQADRDGVVLHGGAGRRRVSWDYAREHLDLAYATTAYGVQGETVSVAHVAVGTHTTASSAYVGMTRGRDRNVAHLVADSIEDARRQWVEVFDRDRADLGPAHAAQRAAEDIERYGSVGPRRRAGRHIVRQDRGRRAADVLGLDRPTSSTPSPGPSIGF